MKIMKKITSLLLALSMCLSLCVSTFAAENSTKDPTLPPWVEEGETWFPANGAMPLEDDSCPQGHYRPDGYVYQGYSTGNTSIEASISSGIVALCSFIPGLGQITIPVSIALLVAPVIEAADHNGRIPGKYYKYVYTKGSSTWEHVVWMNTIEGWPRYLTCKVIIDHNK